MVLGHGSFTSELNIAFEKERGRNIIDDVNENKVGLYQKLVSERNNKGGDFGNSKKNVVIEKKRRRSIFGDVSQLEVNLSSTQDPIVEASGSWIANKKVQTKSTRGTNILNGGDNIFDDVCGNEVDLHNEDAGHSNDKGHSFTYNKNTSFEKRRKRTIVDDDSENEIEFYQGVHRESNGGSSFTSKKSSGIEKERGKSIWDDDNEMEVDPTFTQDPIGGDSCIKKKKTQIESTSTTESNDGGDTEVEEGQTVLQDLNGNMCHPLQRIYFSIWLAFASEFPK
ncbi:unnamed protein product [Cuscuta epithymum]|uniref:Uncharacterized protein n=1 Tax=Cuscuta epithymum TaxID=186058 RepID=A0AAV0GM94_9ASTE|nr:unnamed protein product [Cuscuta epithymum]CAH9148305.1 unnamed protein product [Cuscuta epithymum]